VEANTTRILGSGESAMIRGSAKPFAAGDVLYARLRPYLNKVCAPDFEGVASTEFMVFRPSEVLVPKLLLYLLNRPAFVAYANQNAEGIERPRISWTRMSDFCVTIPPLAEQRRIVAAIEEHFSRIDAAEASLRAAGTRLLVLRRLLFRHMADAPYPRYALSSVADIVSGQTPKGMNPLSQGPIPFFKVGDMNAAVGYEMAQARSYVDEHIARKYKLKIRPAGTVIFPKRGGAIATNKKRILLQPAAFDLNTMGIVPSEKLVPKFLLYWFETVELNALADGSNVPQINLPDVAPLEIPLPPLDEQLRIVTEVERRLSVIDAMAAQIDRALKRSAALRRSILERAFSGRLVPQDPSDEPASVLLGRIRVERAAAESATGRRPRRRATMKAS
jgi:type I restriction enzyme S subunit